jgi:hypothetical protein
VRNSTEPVRLVVIEEHHEAFYVWNYAVRRGWMSSEGNTLLHIDEHADMEIPRIGRPLRSIGDEHDLLAFTYEELNIATFIIPAARLRIFNHIVWMKYSHGQPGFTTPLNLVRRANGGEPAERTELTFVHQAPGAPLAVTQPVQLDIDLDYFYCPGGPSVAREIEVTYSCYREFQDNPYHFLRLQPTHRARGRQEGGRCYLRFYTEAAGQPSGNPEPQIRSRIAQLTADLHAAGVRPSVITICRSVHSGYTPASHAGLIQNELIQRLQALWPLDEYSFEQIIPSAADAAIEELMTCTQP